MRHQIGRNHVISFHIVCSPAPGLVRAGEAEADIPLPIPPPVTPHEALAHIEGLLLFSLQAYKVMRGRRGGDMYVSTW